jgi:prevent-host-death family protein
MESSITATALAKNLSDVLNRIRYRGERFVVERNGEPVAALMPVKANPRVTVGELFERIRRIGWPDDQFPDDLEAIQASQPRVGSPKWPS